MPFNLRKKKRIEKHSRLKDGENAYIVSAFLIAQFGKNYTVDGGRRISGDELMALCIKELSEIRYRIGGNVEYLDCEAGASLIRFYQDQQNFILFGERISENDGVSPIHEIFEIVIREAFLAVERLSLRRLKD